ncbi:MAG TPA: DNA/RNA non-specific endonuclease [Humisphaera sp.]
MSARRRNEPDLNTAVNAFMRLDRRAQVIVLAVAAAAAVVVGVLYLSGAFRREQAKLPPAGPGSATTQVAPHEAPTSKKPPKVRPGSVDGASATASMDLGDPLLLGNPSNASAGSSGDRNNYLLNRPIYALSWNDATGTPNWVSWRTVASNFGNGERAGGFDADPDLPAGFKRVGHTDYSGSGFDRGHMCPKADRDATSELAALTFLTSNIIPQAPNVNQKAWEQLESYARGIVTRQHLRLYTVAGPWGRRGRGLNGWTETTGHGDKVVVPAECWKVIVAIPDFAGPDDPNRVGPDARVIAVVMPNDNDAVGDAWAGFRVTPAQIEQKTGYRFFTNLRPEVAEALRNKLDTEPIAPPKPNNYGRPRPGRNESK